MRLLGMALGLAIALAAPANAISLPASGQLSFDVMRKGADIGEHSYSFSGQSDAFTVDVVTDIVVKVPYIKITAYSFQHTSLETWKNGKLQRLSSTTNADGEPHTLETTDKGVLPASLWSDSFLHGTELINTIDGKIMRIDVADLGPTTIKTKSGNVSGRHYKLSGELERDLWYDHDGHLVQVTFKADDDSTITYIRK